MKKLYEVISAIHEGKEEIYSLRINRWKVLAKTVEEAISKVKPSLFNENGVKEFIDEVILISTIDIE